MKKRLIKYILLSTCIIQLTGCYAIGYMGGRTVNNMLIVDNQNVSNNPQQLNIKSNSNKLVLVNQSTNFNKVPIL